MTDLLNFDQILDSTILPAAVEEVLKVDSNVVVDSLEWALDCAWVWKNQGGRPSLKAAGSGGRFELWKYAKKFPKEFATQIMPKIMPILDRAQAKTPNEDVMRAEEKKSINELQIFMRNIMREANV